MEINWNCSRWNCSRVKKAFFCNRFQSNCWLAAFLTVMYRHYRCRLYKGIRLAKKNYSCFLFVDLKSHQMKRSNYNSGFYQHVHDFSILSVSKFPLHSNLRLPKWNTILIHLETVKLYRGRDSQYFYNIFHNRDFR